MNEYIHIVYVYPVRDGVVDMSDIKYEHAFLFESSARKWADGMNRTEAADGEPEYHAAYFGRVNCVTGKLV